MKKILFVCVLIFALSGCEKTKPEYLISSIGVDRAKDSYKVCFEAVIINTETTAQTLKLLKGEGGTIESAVKEIERQCTQPLLFSHCGIIALGEGITKREFKEVCDFCYGVDDITLSAFFVNTKNAEKLLSVKPLSSACAGYDIMGLLEQNKRYKNRLFEVINSEYNATLPKIAVKDGGLIFESK